MTTQSRSKSPGLDVLRDLYLRQGKTTREISEIYGVRRESVTRWLRNVGIQTRPGNYLAHSPGVATLTDLYCNQNLSCKKISTMYDVSMDTVRSWVMQAGIPLRQQGTSIQMRASPELAKRLRLVECDES